MLSRGRGRGRARRAQARGGVRRGRARGAASFASGRDPDPPAPTPTGTRRGAPALATTPEAKRSLARAFREGDVGKTYVARCLPPRDAPAPAEPAAGAWVEVRTGHGRAAHGLWRVYDRADVGRALRGATERRQGDGERLLVLNGGGGGGTPGAFAPVHRRGAGDGAHAPDSVALRARGSVAGGRRQVWRAGRGGSGDEDEDGTRTRTTRGVGCTRRGSSSRRRAEAPPSSPRRHPRGGRTDSPRRTLGRAEERRGRRGEGGRIGQVEDARLKGNNARALVGGVAHSIASRRDRSPLRPSPALGVTTRLVRRLLRRAARLRLRFLRPVRRFSLPSLRGLQSRVLLRHRLLHRRRLHLDDLVEVDVDVRDETDDDGDDEALLDAEREARADVPSASGRMRRETTRRRDARWAGTPHRADAPRRAVARRRDAPRREEGASVGACAASGMCTRAPVEVSRRRGQNNETDAAC